MKNSNQLLIVLLIGLVMTSETASGQELLIGGIHTRGEAMLERKPEIMRMTVDLLATSETMLDTISKLKERRTKAELQLTALSVPKDSWKFGDVRVDQKQKKRHQRLFMMARQGMQIDGVAPQVGDGSDTATPVYLAQTLTVEWPVDSNDFVEMLVATHKLQEAIHAADLGGKEDVKELAADEAAMGIEADVDDNGNTFYLANGSRTGARKPGEPAFVFVATISEADRQKALAEAFLAAKTEASQLAKAAQVELGGLRSLKASGLNSDEETESVSNYLQVIAGQQSKGTASKTEVTGGLPEILKFHVVVQATFSFK